MNYSKNSLAALIEDETTFVINNKPASKIGIPVAFQVRIKGDLSFSGIVTTYEQKGFVDQMSIAKKKAKNMKDVFKKNYEVVAIDVNNQKEIVFDTTDCQTSGKVDLGKKYGWN